MAVIKRVFSGSDIQMLTVLQIIAGHALEHKAAFQANLSTYDDPYFENLVGRIQAVITEYFGKDAAKFLREATLLIASLQKVTQDDIGLFKTLLLQQFKTNKAFADNTLNTLGFDDSYEAVKNKSQEGLVKLLFQFKKNMDADLKSKIVASGIRAELIDRIIDKADQLGKANVNQEMFKNSKKTDTQEATVQFNALYSEVIDLSKQSVRLFKGNAALKDKFNYSKNLKALTGAASASTVAQKAKEKKALQSV